MDAMVSGANVFHALLLTSYNEPWRVATEPRQDNAVAIKSGIYTVLTVGDYHDGGSDEQAAALAAICAAVNERLLGAWPVTMQGRLHERFGCPVCWWYTALAMWRSR